MSAPGPFQDKPALRVDGLSIARGGRVLFEDLNFAAGPGDYIELRGANGAGKTSLLRALAGFLKPRAGAIAFENVEEPALALHFLGHTNGLKREASVAAHARYWWGLLGGVGDVNASLAQLGLGQLHERLARTLSQGQARRLALARLLIAPRRFWLLDEPAAALDMQGRDLLSGLIDAHRIQGGVVIAAVHEPLGPNPTHALTVGG
ncbi:MAG: heme ABC exporter ATP-binding protein CcmA [Hyphomonadaceae bacterium]|nr:heme ABC exporter ATP-binding protein CcmA [Hyphomonadaceae bacterium]